ncbi:MAG: prepilin-type N-terminal cleavage/methylation domain-containing protein [Planctomycetota bacterium]|nr:prepilin-type N-terminal cleavage/methylation domain-containing protein [Planctomycetota bacterium]
MRRGFTIVEVLVSLGLILGLTAALYAFVDDVIARRERLLERCRSDGAANAVIDRIESDLVSTFVQDADGSAGLRGTRTSLRIVRRRVPAGAGDAARTGSEVSFDDATGRVMGSFLAEAGQAPAEIGRISRLRLRYYDGREWLAEFDSAARGTLPVCVEIRAWLGPAPTPVPADGSSDRPLAPGEDTTDPTADGAPAEQPEAAPPDEDEDESAWGLPDRIRVIVIPDAGGADAAPDEEGAP